MASACRHVARRRTECRA